MPIFIYDKNIIDKLEPNDHRIKFINRQIDLMNSELSKIGKKVFTFFGDPLSIIKKLKSYYNFDTIYYNKDYEPYAIERDKKVSEYLSRNNCSSHSFKDHVIFEQDEIVKDDGKPYVVYTPFSRRWLLHFDEEMTKPYDSKSLLEKFINQDEFNITLEDSKVVDKAITPIDFNLEEGLIDNYDNNRNFPWIKGTSKIGVHLRFGTKSVREIVKVGLKSSDNTYLKELIWREFFIQILYHFPTTVNKSFKEKYERINWRNNMEEFDAWCNGMTGYPIVDAGMRELNSTGFMHNRVRMIVGSFLCKHLLIDWRLGEEYFAKKLFDFEKASNVGNWQWVAGCGVDAAPYFRIFNPYEQQKKFDKNREYVNKWIPELNGSNYPEEIVNHKYARERCLSTYKEALQ
jgi:deoxyribodipyrimidine photo-lyase